MLRQSIAELRQPEDLARSEPGSAENAGSYTEEKRSQIGKQIKDKTLNAFIAQYVNS